MEKFVQRTQKPAFWLFWALLGVVTVLSLIANPQEVPGGSFLTEWLAKLIFGDAMQADKINHFLAYGLLASMGRWGNVRLLQRVWLIIPLLLLWSGGLELLQGLTQSRQPDWFDMIANSAGVFLGYGAIFTLLAILSALGKGRLHT